MAPYTAGQGLGWVDECVAGLLLSCSCAASSIGVGDAERAGRVRRSGRAASGVRPSPQNRAAALLGSYHHKHTLHTLISLCLLAILILLR